MASDVADLLLKIDATTEGLRRELKRAEKSVEGGRKAIVANTKKIDKGFNSMSAGAGRAGSAIKLLGVALAAAGIGRVVTGIVSTTNKFNKSLSELSSITGATGADLDFYSAQAAKMGQTTTLSASEAVKAFQLIASAKPDLLASKEALAAVTAEAVTLAEAAGVDLASAAQTIGVSLNQFGAEAGEAARFVNVLAAGSKFGASQINQTAEALKAAGTASKLVGLTFEETNTAIQLIGSAGIFASQAGTGLSSVLLNLEKQANESFKPSVVGVEQAFKNMAAANLTTTDKMDLFGKEMFKVGAVLIDKSGDFGVLEKSMTGTNTASEQAATNFDNLTGDILRLESANEAAAISIGSKLTPMLRGITQATANFSTGLAGIINSDSLDTIVTGVLAATAAMASFAAPAAFGAALSGLNMIKNAVIGVNAAILLNPVALVAAAMAAAAVIIFRNWDAISLAIENVAINAQIAWERLKIYLLDTFPVSIHAVSAVFDMLKTNILDAVAIIKTAMETAGVVINAVFNGLVGSEVFNALKTTVLTVLGNIKSAIKIAGAVINAVWEGVEIVGSAAFNILKASISRTIGLIKSTIVAAGVAINAVWDGIKTVAGAAFDVLKAGVLRAVEAIKFAIEAAGVVINAVWNGIRIVGSSAAVALELAWEKFKSYLVSVFSPVVNAVSNAFTSLKNNALATMAAIAEAAANPLSAISTFNATFETTAKRLSEADASTSTFNTTAQNSRDRISELEAELKTLNTTTIAVETTVDATATTLEEFKTEAVNATVEVDNFNEAAADVIGTLSNELEALGLSSVELATRNALQTAGVTSTSLLGQEIVALVEEIDKEKTAVSNAEAAAIALEKANVAAAKASDEAWGRTHDYLATTFVSIFENGKGAFSQIASAFTSMIKRMVAEWAASKLMNIMGMGSNPAGAANSPIDAIINGIKNDGVIATAKAVGTKALASIGITTAASTGAAAAAATATAAAATAAASMSGMTAGMAAMGAGGVAPVAAGAAGAGGIGAVGASIASGVSSAGTAVMGALSAVPVWGWAALGVAALATKLDDSGTMSSNAGMLTQDLTSVAEDRKFDIPAFESGAQFTGFNRRTGEDEASDVVNAFRGVDSELTAAFTTALGANPNLNASDFIGFNEKGEGQGSFFGTASEEGSGSGTPIADQLDQFASRWIQVAGQGVGLSQELIDAVVGDGSVEGIMLRANEAANPPATAEEINAAVNSALGFQPAPASVAEVTATIAEATASSVAGLSIAVAEATAGSVAGLTIAVADLNTTVTALTVEASAIRPVMGPQQAGPALSIAGSHFNGLRNVPFDGYLAKLHKGEEVLAANDTRNANSSSEESKNLLSEMRKIASSVKTTADLLTRVTRDGDSLLTEAV